MPMVKNSTLFYILDDTAEINEGLYDMEYIGVTGEEFTDVSNYLDSCHIDVDPEVVADLVKKLLLL